MGSQKLINFLYYKNLLDLAAVDFFKDFNSSFTKLSNGIYMFSSDISRAKLLKYFTEKIFWHLEQLVKPWSVVDPSYWVIVGGCKPQDNMILDFRSRDDYFPAKLQKLLDSEDLGFRWLLKEKDIKLDLQMFNGIFLEIFNMMFSRSKQKAGKLLDAKFKNVIFISHKSLDCYAVFKSLKHFYGRSICSNVKEDKLDGMKICIVAVNDLLAKYVHNKQAMNKSKKFKEAALELKQYLDLKMSEVQEPT